MAIYTHHPKHTKDCVFCNLVRLVNRLGVTVDYLLADSVTDSDANIMEQFKQIIDHVGKV